MKILCRGVTNSCSRCDLAFRPMPDSKLARRREERLKRAADPINKLIHKGDIKEEKMAVGSFRKFPQKGFAFFSRSILRPHFYK